MGDPPTGLSTGGQTGLIFRYKAWLPGARTEGADQTMREPRTLLQMAGAGAQPAPLDESVVVMIDCQREYVDGALPLTGVAAALAECAEVLALGRAAAAPILHVQHRGRPGGLFDPTSTAYEIAGPAAPRAGEGSLTKTLPNAFAGTDLKRLLDETGRKTVVFAGFMTHMCVSSTARAALDQGFASTIVAAACATRDLPDGAGGIARAQDLHRLVLAGLADRFAVVVPRAADLVA